MNKYTHVIKEIKKKLESLDHGYTTHTDAIDFIETTIWLMKNKSINKIKK